MTTWAKDQYNNWVPWIEDMFLKYFTKDNKASYATKGTCRLLPSGLGVTTTADVENRQS